MCCGYSKEPCQWDGSFEHPKHMLKLMGKKYLQFCLSKPKNVEPHEMAHSVSLFIWALTVFQEINRLPKNDLWL